MESAELSNRFSSNAILPDLEPREADPPANGFGADVQHRGQLTDPKSLVCRIAEAVQPQLNLLVQLPIGDLLGMVAAELLKRLLGDSPGNTFQVSLRPPPPN
ncbi:MAG TPA: hypothetical protein PLF84_00040 [Bryobacteraceae bacterium]|jgi:hypothetical protein|nr:hypothetical protein [Bryobacteraceae bacterium]